jgi:hypothetical protein
MVETKRQLINLQREELGANFCEKCNRGPLQIYNNSRRSFLIVENGKVMCLACSQEKDNKECQDILYNGC